MVAASAPGSTATEATDAMQITCHAFMAERWRRAHLKRTVLSVSDWNSHVEREVARYEDGEARLPGLADADDRQRQLTRMGNAAGGAALALLMDGRPDEAAGWFARAAERYRESFADAPPGSWGRPIGAIKARVLAGDWPGA